VGGEKMARSAFQSCVVAALVFKAHRLVYNSTLGLQVLKKKKKVAALSRSYLAKRLAHVSPEVGLGFRGQLTGI